MAVSYGFYSALYINNGYDRIFQSGEISKLFNGVIIDGVYLSARTGDLINRQFMVSANEDSMSVKVAPGRAWFLGTYTISDAYMDLSINTADPLYDRIDAIVIEVNTKYTGYNPEDPGPITERFNNIKVVEGTPASIPVKPTMVHEDGIDQFPIAYITVRNGTTSIRPYDIEYVVGIETPYFAWLGERLNIDQLYSKWKPLLDVQTMPFVTWFDAMQRMLGHEDQDYEAILDEIDSISDQDYIVGTYPKVDEEEYKTSGDGSTKEFIIEVSSDVTIVCVADIFIDGKMAYNYDFEPSTNTVTFTSAPPAGTNNIVIHYVKEKDTYTIYFEEVPNA